MKFRETAGDFSWFMQRHFRLSTACLFPKIYAIKSPLYSFGPIFLGKTAPNFYGSVLVRFTSCRLAKFGWVLLLISVREAWQWSRMHNLWYLWRYSSVYSVLLNVLSRSGRVYSRQKANSRLQARLRSRFSPTLLATCAIQLRTSCQKSHGM